MRLAMKRGCEVGMVVIWTLMSTPFPMLSLAAPLGSDVISQRVGRVGRQCCKPGRRWGCDPTNFRQTGCVHIEKAFPKCWAQETKTMMCTLASCEEAGPEDNCELRTRMVGLNRCRPTGRKTTVGCPPDHWQCHVEMTHYASDDAPKKLGLVCDLATSTICSYSYSPCD